MQCSKAGIRVAFSRSMRLVIGSFLDVYLYHVLSWYTKPAEKAPVRYLKLRGKPRKDPRQMMLSLCSRNPNSSMKTKAAGSSNSPLSLCFPLGSETIAVYFLSATPLMNTSPHWKSEYVVFTFLGKHFLWRAAVGFAENCTTKLREKFVGLMTPKNSR